MIGLEEYVAWIPTADILQPSVNNRCCHAVTEETEDPQHLERTALDPEKLAECMAWSHCSVEVKAYLEHAEASRSDMVKVTQRYDGKYLVENGRHRACFAKRSGVEKVYAKVYEWGPEEDGYVLPGILSDGPLEMLLQIKGQHEPWSGTELFICTAMGGWYPLRFLVHENDAWVDVHPEGIREPFGRDRRPAPLQAFASVKRPFLYPFLKTEKRKITLRIRAGYKDTLGVALVSYEQGHCTAFKVLHRSHDWRLGSWRTSCRVDAGANRWFLRAMEQLPVHSSG